MAMKPLRGEAVWYEFETTSHRSAVSLEQQVERQYESHGLAVYRYFCMMGVAAEVAEELCQDCFLRLFHAVKRKERIRSVRAWLFRVAHNLALNSLAVERGRQRYRTEWLDALVEQCADREPSPEQQAIEHEHFERIHRALATLSPQQRACLCLRAEGLRYREIAETVGISIPSVQEFLRRAIERLKELHL